ncbi:hypothetical protein VOLCADRAFT_109637 [Volvox carteri f. nagariensis]|uniref:Protein kinase domain-containing protein n=1 Tax=Volvox carteri f. nagariensis TaxID=3068 RepID=D8TMY6_VOLCA|nr:uncharacterized protein VOLCADRAFT_109637 [Volvox carteri f. nagariensis]EFJ51334.1 hypothetical protein VOLCADRAFT_109637 [Volvox carteri f. nagariensis]|eukprot:XP_002947801.1 hypothetical protein VOLCADRAFT_109637 [Volvox carteri f. nagariensis]
MPLFSCFGGGGLKHSASGGRTIVKGSEPEPVAVAQPSPKQPEAAEVNVLGPGASGALTGSISKKLSNSSFTRSTQEASEDKAAAPAQGAGSGTSNPAPAAEQAPSSEPVEESTEEEETRPAPEDGKPGPGRAPVPLPQPGCYTHSLKLTSEQTLCQSNIQLCKPEELVGDIKDLAFIGNGSFAAVFKGLWQGAKVAIKFVVSDSLNSNSVTLRESLLGQLLSHPNVIQTYTTRCALMDDDSLDAIHGSATDDARRLSGDSMRFVSGDGFGDPRHKAGGGTISVSNILLQLQVKPGQYVAVVIMEYADRGTLQEAIYKRQVFRESPRWNKRIAARALFRTAREIALGMQHLHSSNVLHGDLKPGNVLLTSARVDRRGFIAKLADFGLSHVAHGPIATNTWGTLRYMAPEHFSGTMSKATDVFAFGMLLWEMVTGKKPYENMTQGEVIQSVSQGLRPQWPPDCFPHLEYLGKRCIAHNPADRPSFGEIVKELEDMEVMLRELLQATRESTGMNAVGAPAGNSPSQAGLQPEQL